MFFENNEILRFPLMTKSYTKLPKNEDTKEIFQPPEFPRDKPLKKSETSSFPKEKFSEGRNYGTKKFLTFYGFSF